MTVAELPTIQPVMDLVLLGLASQWTHDHAREMAAAIMASRAMREASGQ